MFCQFEVFGRIVSMYSLLALAGAFLSGIVFCRMINKRGLNDNDAIAFLLFVVLGVFAGGHLLYAITNIRLVPAILRQTEFSVVLEGLYLMFGGSVFYGGLLGGIAAGFITMKVMHLDVQVYCDCMAPVVPLFHGIARIGCFLGGCCYGIESSFGFAAQNNPYIPEVNGVVRFPVQLLESLCNFILCGVLFVLLKKSEKKVCLKGKLFRIYLMSYAVIRFFDEFLRGDEIRGFVGVLSVSQFISILIFSVCALSFVADVFLKNRIKEKREKEIKAETV